MKKRIISLFLVVTMVIGILFTVTFDTCAIEESTIPNNTEWNQFYVTHNTTEYFSLDVPKTGKLQINIFAATYDSRIYCSFYDNDYENKIDGFSLYVNSNTPGTATIDRVLTKGKYHLLLEIGDKSGYVKLKTKYSNYGCNTKDSSTYDDPNILKSGTTAISAFTWTNSDTSWFKITLSSKSTVQFNFYAYSGLYYDFYNRDLSEKYFYRDWSMGGDDSSPDTAVEKMILNKGTYYLKCCQRSDGRYKIKFSSYTKPKLNCTKVTLKTKGKKQLKVTGGSGKIKWSTSNKKIAVVNSSGKVTAKRKGSCVITAKRNGYSMRCSVYVR